MVSMQTHVWLEYPRSESGVPRFLIDQGVKIIEWTDGDEHSPAHEHTPDYSDERLVKALEAFIAALGRRYDHDPRDDVQADPSAARGERMGPRPGQRGLGATIGGGAS